MPRAKRLVDNPSLLVVTRSGWTAASSGDVQGRTARAGPTRPWVGSAGGQERSHDNRTSDDHGRLRRPHALLQSAAVAGIAQTLLGSPFLVQCYHGVNRAWSGQTFERDIVHRRQAGHILHRSRNALADQDLTVASGIDSRAARLVTVPMAV